MGLKQTTEALLQLGTKLGFVVGKEIQSADTVWTDVVWFDPRFDYGPKKGSGTLSSVHGWEHPVVPIAGFEIEASAQAKPVKGSVINLATLGAALNIIVLTEENLPRVRKMSETRKDATNEQIWKITKKRVLGWVSEVKVNTRIVVMTEPEVKSWALSKGIAV